jgi:hypothetical protein
LKRTILLYLLLGPAAWAVPPSIDGPGVYLSRPWPSQILSKAEHTARARGDREALFEIVCLRLERLITRRDQTSPDRLESPLTRDQAGFDRVMAARAERTLWQNSNSRLIGNLGVMQDDVALQFFSHFYARLAGGGTPMQSFRLAQDF